MEGFIALSIIVGLLVALGLLASRFGADSRTMDLDDWRRSVAR